VVGSFATNSTRTNQPMMESNTSQNFIIKIIDIHNATMMQQQRRQEQQREQQLARCARQSGQNMNRIRREGSETNKPI
jgi:hypothetical protein